MELRTTAENVTQHKEHPSLTPKQAMWVKIRTNYVPFPHPSHIACHPPIDNKPAPASCSGLSQLPYIHHHTQDSHQPLL